MQSKRKRKHQQGSVWLRGSKFFLRYSGPDKKQRTEFLVARDERHHSASCKPVKDLAARSMARVNAGAGTASASASVADFWTSTYLPFAEQNLRPSTVDAYEDLWARLLEPRFGTTRLGEYRPSDATEFLTGLTKQLGRNSINHVRSRGSHVDEPRARCGPESSHRRPESCGCEDVGKLLHGYVQARVAAILALRAKEYADVISNSKAAD
jgi:hypothetical protein